jgi:hypothetical protein
LRFAGGQNLMPTTLFITFAAATGAGTFLADWFHFQN